MWEKKAVQKKIYLSQKTAIPPDVDTYSSQRIKSLENQLFRLEEEMEKRGACQLKKEKKWRGSSKFPKGDKKVFTRVRDMRREGGLKALSCPFAWHRS